MKVCLVMPIHNEAPHLAMVLDSFVDQELKPDILVIVNDHSTDNSLAIARDYASKISWIEVVDHKSSNAHRPGAKVIRAFNAGLSTIQINEYDLIGKFDGDIMLPQNYFKELVKAFTLEPKLGLASGLLYINKNNTWVYENLAKKSKVRGPIKLYRKACFKDLNGLSTSIGWDTADTLLARFYNWQVKTYPYLKVKHLRPTGVAYSKTNAQKQGQTFYALRYGFMISNIAIIKLAWKHKSFDFYFNALRGFFTAKSKGVLPIVNAKQGKFIRKLRVREMLRKLQ